MYAKLTVKWETW